MRKSTLAVLAAVLTLLTAVTAAFVVPAGVGAATKPAVVIGANQAVELKEPGLPPSPGYPYSRVGYLDPELCGDGGIGEVWCNHYPVRLDLSEQQLRNNIYLFLVTLDWPGEIVSVPTVVIATVPQLAMTIWEDPIVEDEEPAPPCENPELAPGVPDPAGLNCPAAPEERPGGDEPLFETVFDPGPLRWGTLVDDQLTFSIEIANYAGANDEYTLLLEVVEVEGTPDLSIDEEVVDLSAIDQSVDRPAVPTSSFDGFSSPASDAIATDPGLDLADIGTDRDLDRLGIRGDDLLGFDDDTAELLARRNIRDIRPPGDEATWALVLWLVVVPLAVLGGIVAWGLRRRATLFADI